MKQFVPSPAIKANFKAEVLAKLAPKPVAYEIISLGDYKGWARAHPGPAKLLSVIVVKWRASSSRSPISQGYWAAYTHLEWCEVSNIKAPSTLKYQLNQIEGAGLIERTRHHHSGVRVLSFIRPTELALRFFKPTPRDWRRLGTDQPPASGKSQKYAELESAFRAAYQIQTGLPLLVVGKSEKSALKGIFNELSGDSIEIVSLVVKEWSSFQNYIKHSIGYWQGGSQPSAALIRKHLQLAIQYSAKAKIQSPSKSLAMTKKPKAQIAQKAVASTEPAEADTKPATYDEFLAIMNDEEPSEAE